MLLQRCQRIQKLNWACPLHSFSHARQVKNVKILSITYFLKKRAVFKNYYLFIEGIFMQNNICFNMHSYVSRKNGHFNRPPKMLLLCYKSSSIGVWIGRAGQHTAVGAKPLAYVALDWVCEKVLFSFPNPCGRNGRKSHGSGVWTVCDVTSTAVWRNVSEWGLVVVKMEQSQTVPGLQLLSEF